MLANLKKQFTAKPLTTVSKIVGTVVGIIAIITFSGDVSNYVDTQIITESELMSANATVVQQIKESEDRITERFTEESTLIRLALVTEIIARQAALSKLLDKSTKIGEIKSYEIKIEALTKKINKLLTHEHKHAGDK